MQTCCCLSDRLVCQARRKWTNHQFRFETLPLKSERPPRLQGPDADRERTPIHLFPTNTFSAGIPEIENLNSVGTPDERKIAIKSRCRPDLYVDTNDYSFGDVVRWLSSCSTNCASCPAGKALPPGFQGYPVRSTIDEGWLGPFRPPTAERRIFGTSLVGPETTRTSPFWMKASGSRCDEAGALALDPDGDVVARLDHRTERVRRQVSAV